MKMFFLMKREMPNLLSVKCETAILETLDYVSCFPQPTLLSCSSRFLRALKLNRAQSRLF